MIQRKVQSKKRYLASFIIGTFLFILIIAISYSIAWYQYTRISNLQSELAYALFEKKSLNYFFGEDICLEENFKEMSDFLGYQGRILEDLENKFGKNNKQVLERKKFYSVLLLEHLDYVNDYNENCEKYQNTILFFYSNKDKSEDSDKAGRILSRVNSQNRNVSIYSFDVNLESLIITRLKEKYGVDSYPKIIVNEEHEFFWPFSSEEIVFLLK